MLFKVLMILFAICQCVAMFFFFRYQKRLVRVYTTWPAATQTEVTPTIHYEEPLGNKRLRLLWFFATLFSGASVMVSFGLYLLYK